MTNRDIKRMIVGMLGALFLLTLSIMLLSASLMRSFFVNRDLRQAQEAVASVPTPTLAPTPIVISERPTPEVVPGEIRLPRRASSPNNLQAYRDLDLLWGLTLPERDYAAVDERYGREFPPPAVQLFNDAPQIGDRRTIFVQTEETVVELVAQSSQVEIWQERSLEATPAQLQPILTEIEDQILPKVVEIAGRALEPPVGEPGPIEIIHLSSGDSAEWGFFNSADQYTQAVFSTSNEANMVYLNMGELGVGSEAYFGTLSHELLHLFHWQADHNEKNWVDEGLAQAVELLVGYETVSIEAYLDDSTIQLNRWPQSAEAPQDIYDHYAASALFFIYFWEQLGDNALRMVVQTPADGMAGLNQVVEQIRPEGDINDLFSDWVAANYLNGYVEDARYRYRHQVDSLWISDQLVAAGEDLQLLPQYGVQVYELPAAGRYDLVFDGDGETALIDDPPHSGSFAWVAPGGNEVDASLVHPIDLSEVSRATLRFWVWTDLEERFDFLYLMVSSDGGERWERIEIPGGVYSRYGEGLTGNTDGWRFVEIPLDRYTGREVLLRFNVLTDSIQPGRGVAIDDVHIPEIGFADDMEGGQGGWQSAGFVRIGSVMPQAWSVQLMSRTGTPSVIELDVDQSGRAIWPVDIREPAALAIAPMNPFTAEWAAYQIRIEPSE